MKTSFLLGAFLIGLSAVVTGQNVGIGTPSPTQKLDVAGRVHLRQAGSQTAGIWLDGPTLPNRSFVGTLDEDHVGLFGSVAGWKMVMNVETGYVGIGNAAPTANLDVNGTLRFRGSFPKKGSVLTSDDANGNASWADPIAFRASSLVDGANLSITKATWTKVPFSTTANYNLGLFYQPLNAQFYVGENGIYAFHALLTYDNIFYSQTSSVRLRLNRNGVLSTLAQRNFGDIRDNTDVSNDSKSIIQEIYAELQLQSGDYVWVETYAGDNIYYNSNLVNTALLLANNTLTYFTGRLVARL